MTDSLLVKVSRPTATGPWVIDVPGRPSFCVATRYEAVIVAAREEKALFEAKMSRMEAEEDRVRYCDYRSCTAKADWRVRVSRGGPGNPYTNAYCETCRAHLVLPVEDLVRLTPETIKPEGAKLRPVDLKVFGNE